MIIDIGQRKDKIGYCHNFKTRLGVNPELGLGHGSGWPLTRVNVRIKIVVNIVLKLDLGVYSGPDSGYRLGWPLNRVNIKIKMVIIIVLKSYPGVNLG